MIPDTTYTIKQYFRNGVRIDCLIPEAGGAEEYYLIMQINTNVGPIQQTPRIEADNIADAYAKAEAVATETVEALKKELGHKIVKATSLPKNRMGPGGPIPGVTLP